MGENIMRYVAGIVGFFSVFAASTSWAATVQVSSGEVFIDRGNGYSMVTGSTTGKPGDVVMAKAGGSAVIIYGDGCVQNVDVGTIATIVEVPPCAVPGPDYALIVGGVVVAGGVAAAIILSGDDDKPASGQ
jgi:hypothetical protein